MPVVPAGVLGELMQTVSTLVAGSQTFIAQCALDGLTPADQIFWHALRPESEGDVVNPTPISRPFVLLRAEQFQYDEWAPECMQPKATIRLHINDKFRSAGFQDSAKEFTTFYGKLIDDIQKNNYADAGIVARSIIQTQEPVATQRRDVTTTYGFWHVEFDLAVGADF